MDSKEKKRPITQEDIMNLLDSCYEKCLNGIPKVSRSVEDMANVGSVIYVQMRMIACVAYMADYELNSDQTQTFVYACLAGVTR